jgi:hypothetical protein
MNEMKGGARKPPITRKTTAVPKYNPADEYEPPVKEAPRKIEPVTDLPKTIGVRATSALRAIVPGSVWRQRPFKWEPQQFAPESERLKDTIKDESIQNRSFKQFLDDPTLPMIYCIAGNPDDSKAKYFATYLIARHLDKLGANAKIVWEVMYGGFKNPLIDRYGLHDEERSPTLLVMSNLSPVATDVKLDKCRDNIERFHSIPRLIIVSGEDPYSFMLTRLHGPFNGMAYFSESLLKKRVEIF